MGALTVLLSVVGTRSYDGSDGWIAAKLFAAPLFRSAALQPGSDSLTVFTGLLVAGLLGAALAAPFGAAAHRLHGELAVPAGALYGLALWGVARFLVWPALGAAWQGSLSGLLPGWGVALLFLLYGAAIGVGIMIAALLRDLHSTEASGA